MINLKPNIRAFLVSDSAITSKITTYKGQPAIFTRRPVPEDAQYPFIVISSQIPSGRSDLVDAVRGNYVHDVIVYAQNNDNTTYNTCEQIAFLLSQKFLRLQSTDMSIPSGYQIIDAVGIGPFDAPTDGDTTVAKGVSVSFRLIKQ